tara:strand:- start:264 stop:443 length:180 start_codon:yes stop_codon:yes gene_type:complete
VVKLARPTINEIKSHLDTLEAVSNERFTETINRIKRLEMIIIGSGGAIILLLVNIAFGG